MMLFLAFVVCNWLAGRRAVSEGVPKETIQDLAIWLIVGGLIGARLTSVLSTPQLADSLWEISSPVHQHLGRRHRPVRRRHRRPGQLRRRLLPRLPQARRLDAQAGRHHRPVAGGRPLPGPHRLLPQRLLLRPGRLHRLPRLRRLLPAVGPAAVRPGQQGLSDRGRIHPGRDKKGAVGVASIASSRSSEAAWAGLKAGDEILGVDGYALSDHSPYLVPPGAELRRRPA